MSLGVELTVISPTTSESSLIPQNGKPENGDSTLPTISIITDSGNKLVPLDQLPPTTKSDSENPSTPPPITVNATPRSTTTTGELKEPATPPPVDSTKEKHPASDLQGSKPAENPAVEFQKDTEFINMLHNGGLCRFFFRFLETTYCTENLMFYAEIECFHKIQDQNLLMKKAQWIWEHYFDSEAPFQLSLEHCIYLKAKQKLKAPDTHMFDEAQRHVVAFMHMDSWYKFKRTSDYNLYLRARDGITGTEDDDNQCLLEAPASTTTKNSKCRCW